MRHSHQFQSEALGHAQERTHLFRREGLARCRGGGRAARAPGQAAQAYQGGDLFDDRARNAGRRGEGGGRPIASLQVRQHRQPLRIGRGGFQVRPGRQAEPAVVGLQQRRVELPRRAPPHHFQRPRLGHFRGVRGLPLFGGDRSDAPVGRVRGGDHLRQRHAPQQVQAPGRAVGHQPQQAVFQQQAVRAVAVQADRFQKRRQRGRGSCLHVRRRMRRYQQATHRIDDVTHASTVREVARAGMPADRQPWQAARTRRGDGLLAFVAAVVGHQRGGGRGAPVHHADVQPVGHQQRAGHFQARGGHQVQPGNGQLLARGKRGVHGNRASSGRRPACAPRRAPRASGRCSGCIS
ncbi:hypothetical protein BV378_13970 [Nostoc sp. RF31YmG]|nr:hypothetical protein BV378_13970 [Nostoc sp. RF31YmG]